MENEASKTPGSSALSEPQTLTDALVDIPIADWFRIWCTGRAKVIPLRLAHQIQRSITDTALSVMTVVSMFGLVSTVSVVLFLVPRNQIANVWLVVHAGEYVIITVGLAFAHFLQRQGTLSAARFNVISIPAVVLGGVCWGTLPLIVGLDDISMFYLATCVSAMYCLVGFFWTMGHWPLSILYAATLLATVVGTYSYFGRPEVLVASAMAVSFLLSLMALSMVISVGLVRSRVEMVLARDRREMIHLLLRDYERGGHDWVWETDEDLRLFHLPPRMVVAARGDQRVEPGVSLLALVVRDEQAMDAIQRRLPFQTVVPTAGPDGAGEVRLWGRPNTTTGRFLGYRGVGSDQGAARRAAEAERNAERFDAMVELTSGITHDFNNQLATILGSVELAGLSHSDEAEMHAHLERAAEACLRGRSMTADLSVALGLHAPAEAVPFHVERCVADVLAEIGPLYPPMRLSYCAAPGVWGHSDPNHFVRAVRNLVENACQANERNPSSTGIVSVEIDVVADSQASTMARVRVIDDGPGIEAADVHRLFEPFYTTRKAEGGTGLGLAVSQGFARQAGGTLTVSARERGALFELQIPAASSVPAIDDSQQPVPLASLVSTESLDGEFLVVEDDQYVASMLRTWLSAFGAKVDLVGTVAEAIERVRTRGDQYDCVISDLVLPDGEGFGVISELRRTQSRTPAVYVSGFTRTLPSAIESHLRCPFVAKPFSSAELFAAIRTAGLHVADNHHRPGHEAPSDTDRSTTGPKEPESASMAEAWESAALQSPR